MASADAVLIIAPKYAPQPALADRCACMMTLAVGQHLHTQWSALQKQSRNLAVRQVPGHSVLVPLSVSRLLLFVCLCCVFESA